jgi:ethanolamine ammonia-lyase large subunit
MRRHCRRDPRRAAAGSGDAVIGINPAGTACHSTALLRMIDACGGGSGFPTQSCVLAHITTQMAR